MKSYIGFDEREAEAAEVARKSLRRVTNDEVEPEFLCMAKLEAHGLIRRTVDQRGSQDFDLVSGAPQSTRFAISRFLTPILCQQGYALFTDSDVVFVRDPRDMLLEVQAKHAVSVVKHGDLPTQTFKMVNQRQQVYHRKNWSSVMLFNCDHPANRRLSLRDVNERPGRNLHALYWLHDDEIGALDPCWNWLVNVQPRPPKLGIAHMTLGGPWIDGWKGGGFDAEWEAAR
ncbi:MAG: hypothetical protein ABIP06_06440 [Pyrinomonadaceae bacterium]